MKKKWFIFLNSFAFILLLNFQFFEFNTVSQILILWVVSLLPFYNRNFLKTIILNRKTIFFSVIWVLILITTTLYSENNKDAINSSQKVLLLLIAPFIFIPLPKRHLIRHLNIAKIVFPISTIAFLLFLFIKLCVFWHEAYTIQYGEHSIFNYIKFIYNHRFSYLLESSQVIVTKLFFHKAYYSIFVITSMLLVQLLEISRIKKILIHVVLFLFLLIVMAKTQIFIGVFILCYLIHQNIKQKKPFVYAISIIVIALMFFSIKNKDRIFKTLESTFETRIEIYKSAKDILSDNLLLGVGLGDTQIELNKAYQKRNCISCRELNTHNYYLYLGLSSGIIGLLAFIVSSLFILKISYNNKTLFIFLILIYFSLFFENIFYRMWGSLIYAIFTNLLLSYNLNKNEDTFFN